MVVAVVAGVLLIGLAAVDGVLTVLHPTRRGPVSFVMTRGLFLAARAIARAAGRPAWLSAVGPLAVLVVFGGWALLLWVGFALVYLPFVGDLSYSSASTYGGRGMLEALYLSGTSLTTVGFGDVTGDTDVLRLVTAVEAGTGFGVISASITYLLSVYPLTSSIRGAARLYSPAGDPSRAADAVAIGGASYLQGLQEQLIAIDEDTERFPLLYFYRATVAEASLVALLHGAIVICLQARWGVAPARAPHARFYGRELERSLDNIFEHFAGRFLLRAPARVLDRSLDLDDARRRLERLRRAARDCAVSADDVDEAQLSSFAAFVGRGEAFLESLADHELRRRPALLPAA